MHAYVIIYFQDSFFQACTDHLHRLHHQCYRVFHLLRFIFISLVGLSHQLYVGI